MGRADSSLLNSSGDAPGRCNLGAAKSRQCEKIKAIRSALVAAGFLTVDSQAKVLGLSRSTTWKVLRGDQKNSGISASTVKRMLVSAALPPAARSVIQEYVHEKLLGAYGHPLLA